VALEAACGGEQVELRSAGGPLRYWHVTRPLRKVLPEGAGAASEYAAVLGGARQQFDELGASAALCHAANAAPEDLLFMDAETCGLSAAAVFLVGMMAWRDGELLVDQCFARDYSQEPGVLQAFCRRHEQAGVLVTFNGAAFDLPLIRERMVVHGLAEPWSVPPHLDLLPEARRRWRGRLRRCRLQTIERRVLGRRRQDDIPSGQIPDAYHTFVRTGDAREMAAVMHHNAMDLLTMVQLVCLLLTGCDPVMD
jgi:hypothetical protein